MLLLLFPVRTDAPIYHFPYATLGLIGANIAAFVVTWIMPICFDIGDFHDYEELFCITLGGTLEPLKWVTATFFHFDPGHLIFNMLFLWTFGLLVEGKLGWRRFLAVYLAIGVLGAAAIQAIVFGMDGSSWAGGASVAISGLMLISYLWAPKNDIGIAYFLWILFFIRLGEFQLTISTFVVIYLILQGLSALAQQTFLTSEFMHAVGFIIGGLIGYWLLRTKRVDCERWDLFSIMKGQHGRQLKQVIYEDVDQSYGPSEARKREIRKRKEKAKAARAKQEQGDASEVTPLSSSDQAALRIRQLLKSRKAIAALQLINERRQVDNRFEIPGPDILRLAQQLHELDRSDESVRFLSEYLERHPVGSDRVRLTLAALMIQIQQRPTAALRVLEPVEVGDLNEADRKKYRTLSEKANAMIEDGVIEFGEGAW